MRGQGFFRGPYARCLPRTLSHPLQQVVESSCQSHHTPRGRWTLTSGGPHSLISNVYNFKLFSKWHGFLTELNRQRQEESPGGGPGAKGPCALFRESWVGAVFLCSHTWAALSPGLIRVSPGDVTGSFSCCRNGWINLHLMGRSAMDMEQLQFN